MEKDMLVTCVCFPLCNQKVRLACKPPAQVCQDFLTWANMDACKCTRKKEGLILWQGPSLSRLRGAVLRWKLSRLTYLHNKLEDPPRGCRSEGLSWLAVLQGPGTKHLRDTQENIISYNRPEISSNSCSFNYYTFWCVWEVALARAPAELSGKCWAPRTPSGQIVTQHGTHVSGCMCVRLAEVLCMSAFMN